MAITIVDGQFSSGLAASSADLALPAGATSGHLLIASLNPRSGGASGVGGEAGWIADAGDPAFGLSVWSRVHGGVSGTQSFPLVTSGGAPTTGDYVGGIGALSGADQPAVGSFSGGTTLVETTTHTLTHSTAANVLLLYEVYKRVDGVGHVPTTVTGPDNFQTVFAGSTTNQKAFCWFKPAGTASTGTVTFSENPDDILVRYKRFSLTATPPPTMGLGTSAGVEHATFTHTLVGR